LTDSDQPQQIHLDYSGIPASWAFIPLIYAGEDRETALRIASLMFLTTSEGALPKDWKDSAPQVLDYLRGSTLSPQERNNVTPMRRPTLRVVPPPDDNTG